MSTDKTLADVQPGGRVRLGDGREPMLESMWVEIRREGDRTFPRVMTKDQADAFLRMHRLFDFAEDLRAVGLGIQRAVGAAQAGNGGDLL